MNLAIIQIFLTTLNDFERVKSHGALHNLCFAKHGGFATIDTGHIFSNLSLSHLLFHKVGFALTSFYDIKIFQFDQVEIDSQLENFSFFLLLVTVIIYWFETAFHSKAEKQKFASSMVKLSNLSLTFLLGTRWITSHHFPLSNLYESLLFLSWSLTVIHLILEKISNTLLIGVLLSPITLFVNGFALFTLPAEMQKGNFLTPALQSNWLMMHVTVMISSYAALLSGSILAIAFLIVTKNINKNDSFVFLQSQKISGTIPLPRVDGEHKFPNLVPPVRGNKQLISDPDNFSFDKITKNSFNNLAFVKENKQLSSDSFVGSVGVLSKIPSSAKQNQIASHFDEVKMKEQQNKETKNKEILFRKQNGPNAFFEEKRGSQNRTHLAKTLDNLSYRTIGIGFPLLTIGILSGAVWANEAWGSYWSWDPKETWALITWFLFAIYLHTRITKGLQGEKPAIIASVGFVVIWICFLGVNLASQGLHTYGWLQ